MYIQKQLDHPALLEMCHWGKQLESGFLADNNALEGKGQNLVDDR